MSDMRSNGPFLGGRSSVAQPVRHGRDLMRHHGKHAGEPSPIPLRFPIPLGACPTLEGSIQDYLVYDAPYLRSMELGNLLHKGGERKPIVEPGTREHERCHAILPRD